MSNKHYPVDEEFEVDLTVKVKLKSISNYTILNERDQIWAIEAFKQDIEEWLLDKLAENYYNEEVTNKVDYYSFEVRRK